MGSAAARNMNRIRELRHRAGYDIVDFADSVGADVVEIALAEMGVGLVRFDLGVEMARALDISPAELFPLAGSQIEELIDLEGDELRRALLEEPRASRIASAGLDPDMLPWYGVVRLASGNERKYLFSSFEMHRFREELRAGDGRAFVSFLADCRHVIVRAAAIKEIVFTNSTGYARFSSEQSAFEVVLVSEINHRIEHFEVAPDGGEDGTGPRPFGALLDAVRVGTMPSFVVIATEHGDERLVRAETIEVMEVPVGVLMPGIYFESVGEAGLASMDTVGCA